MNPPTPNFHPVLLLGCRNVALSTSRKAIKYKILTKSHFCAEEMEDNKAPLLSG